MKSSGFGELPAPLTPKPPIASMAPVREVSDAGICAREWRSCKSDRSYLAAPRRSGRNDSTVFKSSSDMDEAGGGADADGIGGGDGSFAEPAFWKFRVTLYSVNRSFGSKQK